MKLAIMQPYFFPYIGYWQLIHAADTFLLFDDIQYIRHGWINRNRIINPQGGWQYVTVPLEKHKQKELIRNIVANPQQDWKIKLLSQLNHYRRCAPYFQEIANLISNILQNINDNRICRINYSIICGICMELGLQKNILVSSDYGFDYSLVTDAGEWALRIAEQLDATQYINPISGASLFANEKFEFSGIKLSFLKSGSVEYYQKREFEPWLSIIDVLMFNGAEGTKEHLLNYSIQEYPER